MKNNKTVSLQCNIIKGLPNISFEYTKNLFKEEFAPKTKPTIQKKDRKEKALKKDKTVKKLEPEKKVTKINKVDVERLHSKSEILKPKIDLISFKVEKKVEVNDGSFKNFYNFVSTKLISQRIKVM